MDIACFRWSCELVSGRAEVASTGAEDLVLGVVCVGGGEKKRGGRGKVPRIRGKMVHFPGRTTNQEWAFRIRISERSGSPGAGNFATG